MPCPVPDRASDTDNEIGPDFRSHTRNMLEEKRMHQYLREAENLLS